MPCKKPGSAFLSIVSFGEKTGQLDALAAAVLLSAFSGSISQQTALSFRSLPFQNDTSGKNPDNTAATSNNRAGISAQYRFFQEWLI